MKSSQQIVKFVGAQGLRPRLYCTKRDYRYKKCQLHCVNNWQKDIPKLEVVLSLNH
jgi:hypothetical protein